MDKKFTLAIEAQNNAYSIYSNFKVGACVVLTDGNYFIGSNVENSSYGLTNCAERSALFACYSNGYRKEDILELVVCTSNEIPSSPCGACRQVIYELMEKDAVVTLINPKLVNTITLKVNDLLPLGFDGDKLNEN